MNIYETIVNLQKQGKAGVLITVVSKEGHGPQIPGAKLLVSADNEKTGTIGGGTLEYAAINEVSSVLTNKASILKKYLLGEDSNIIDPASSQPSGIETGMICGGNISLFYEYIGANDNVIIFGAGHVGKALAYYLKPLSYNVIIIDSRPEVLNDVNDTDKLLVKNHNSLPFNEIPIAGSYVIITTHSHELDYQTLKSICLADVAPKYIGMIASRKKSEKMMERLSAEIDKEKIDFSRLYTPIGLKIGGSSPEEIALSIASELQVIKYSQEGNRHARRIW